MKEIVFAVAALAFSTHIACAAMTEDEFSGMADGLGQPCRWVIGVADRKYTGPNDNLQTLNPIDDWLASLPYGWSEFDAMKLIIAECRLHPKDTVAHVVNTLLYDRSTNHLPRP
jgi:hypothetical protein